MQKVEKEELVENKVLEFSLFDQNGDKLFDAGEILTPGKLMQLQQVNEVFKDENEQLEANKPSQDILGASEQVVTDEFEMDSISDDELITIDDIDVTNFKGPLNKTSKVDIETQMKFKAFHIYFLNSLNSKHPSDLIQLSSHLRERLISDIILKTNGISYFSQLKLIGEYKKCHPLNVAILSGVLALKMGLSESAIADIVLGALLHDIGKTKIPSSILYSQTPSDKDQKIIQSHTKIGYKVLKEEWQLPENISKVALEHHERSNGSGYPYGKSGDFIGLESRIVSVCNEFDNLISNQTAHKISNCHEALKILLDMGSKKFAADALYTFVHMFSYNDTESLEEMTV